jgi:hypothetical protein
MKEVRKNSAYRAAEQAKLRAYSSSADMEEEKSNQADFDQP